MARKSALVPLPLLAQDVLEVLEIALGGSNASIEDIRAS